MKDGFEYLQHHRFVKHKYPGELLASGIRFDKQATLLGTWVLSVFEDHRAQLPLRSASLANLDAQTKPLCHDPLRGRDLTPGDACEHESRRKGPRANVPLAGWGGSTSTLNVSSRRKLRERGAGGQEALLALLTGDEARLLVSRVSEELRDTYDMAPLGSPPGSRPDSTRCTA